MFSDFIVEVIDKIGNQNFQDIMNVIPQQFLKDIDADAFNPAIPLLGITAIVTTGVVLGGIVAGLGLIKTSKNPAIQLGFLKEEKMIPGFKIWEVFTPYLNSYNFSTFLGFFKNESCWEDIMKVS